jgi:phytoene synthase
MNDMFSGNVPTVLEPLNEIIEAFNIPHEFFQEFFLGLKMDMEKNRYQTIDDLLQYCEYVACSVGRVCVCVFSNNVSDVLMDYATNVGYALQLTNIIRDVYGDALVGRCYLPQEDMDRYNYTFEDILNQRYDDDFCELMQVEGKRALAYYGKAQICYDTYISRGGAAKDLETAQMMLKIYLRTLKKIKSHHYGVLKEKPIKLTKVEKMKILAE